MGRMDIQSLNVPAEFSAIFDQNHVKAAPEAVPANEPAPPTASDVKQASAPGTCSKCNCKVSAVETKMGRCLTCGNNLHPAGATPANYRVGI